MKKVTRGYVKVPATQPLPTSVEEQQNLSDEAYKKHIFKYLLEFYQSLDTQEVWDKIIASENRNPDKHKEREGIIRDLIERKSRKNKEFTRAGFRVNAESNSEGKQKGHYDLKFEHSYWQEEKEDEIIPKFFVFECKCLAKGASKHTVAEYVFVDNKTKTDGGVYRFLLDDKYATEQDFGGMIAFVLNGNTEDFISKIKDALKNLKDKGLDFGHLIPNGIIDKSIEENSFTFDSIHTRKNGEQITLHHIIFDFTPKEDA